ncbi:hypothetical protein GPJ56_008897 [Histomonas meleagridis]|uniref:uncharacterized protein n=1 Tax=Histomonas meleagridis TaxID=135588 RepID=UPI003559846E|nr:hypothetical protein GPJ56_008897 [Histomonas meleagridis]KAH0797823.1 hypothetical protein GO595_009452 [Histomonas meleagridis]
MKENEKVYLEEINPKVEPPEIIRVPVLTPEPRLQIAQSQMNFVKRNKPLNYWLSPESEFVVLPECKKCLPKPIPKSAKLYDMPDPNVRMDKPPKDPVSFRPTKMIISPRRPADLGFYKTEVSRPQTTSKQDYVDFGDVKLGKKAHAQFILTNIGKAPLKYSFSKPKNTSVRVLTVPGIVAPGLKLKIKLEIEPKKIGEIDTYFLLISNQGEMKIPVYGNVIK